jgi:VIT1/CCC1 family predicted Fe2+/Mn2+ transporter
MTTGSTRVLDPSERTAEVLFGLIMVLTFTGSLSMAEAGRAEIRTMLIGALGCNIAWGAIDGVLYLMGALAARSSDLALYRAVRGAAAPADGHGAIRDALPPVVASAIGLPELEHIRQRLSELPDEPRRGRLSAQDWRGAVGVFLLVFLSTLPVALPFVIMQDGPRALRVSNAVAVAMLFVVGAAYGRSVQRRPVAVGVSMVVLGMVLVAVTMALGG